MANELERYDERLPALQANLMPVQTVQEAGQMRSAIVQFVQQIMRPGVDYGVIPGTDGKPTLLKSGAEKLRTFFGLSAEITITESEEDWTGKGHGGEPFFYYMFKCSLSRDGYHIADGIGSCNSFEKKYRYRNQNRTCPQCGNATIIKGKEEYGGGWLCHRKRGGCGANFPDDAPEITMQRVGKVPNPEVFDAVNTIQKMGKKRALVDAILLATSASEYYSQDMEDFERDEEGEGDRSRQQAQQQRPARQQRTSTTPANQMPVNDMDGPCPECHAPTGKRHASTCKIVAEEVAA